MSKNKQKMTQSEIGSARAERLQLVEKFAHVRMFTNIFYELVSIQGFIIPTIEKDAELIACEFSQFDKKCFNEIVKKIHEIRYWNDRMNEPFYDSMNSSDFDEMRRNANVLVRFISLFLSRCALDPEKVQFIERIMRNMPSNGIISDEIIDKFTLR